MWSCQGSDFLNFWWGESKGGAGSLTYRSPAGNELATPLNVVTLRFVAPEAFDRRVGTVGGRAAGDRARSLGVAELQSYASLLGDEVAEQVAAGHAQTFAAMAAAPAAVKAAVSCAYRRQRSTRGFDKK